jgi:tetratricopeptide (TPR) repeat protein
MRTMSIPLRRLFLPCCMALCAAPIQGAARQSSAPAADRAAQNTTSAQQTTRLEQLQQQLKNKPSWTEGWWQLGTAAYDADRFDVAIPALQHVLEAAPKMGIAWDLLGLSQFGVKQYDEARASLDEAATLANTNDPDVERVAVYHHALLLIRNDDFARAESLLRTTFGSNPNAQVSFALGLAALHVPLLPSEVDPTQEALLRDVGALTAQGDAGLPKYKDLIAAHPDVPFLHYAYARALQHAGQNAEALAELRQQTTQTPDSFAVWASIAQLETKFNHPVQAATAQLKADAARKQGKELDARVRNHFSLTSQPTGDASWSQTMQVYSAGHYADAASQLRPWVVTHPNDGTAWAVLGLSEYQLNDFNNARIHLERGATLGLRGDPNAVGTALYTLGVLLLRTGDSDGALANLKQAQKLLPTEDRITEALGLALLRRSDLPKAGTQDEALAKAAGQIDLLLQGSRYDEAFPAFQELLQHYPTAPNLHYAYGSALMALSEFDKAAAEMREELRINPQSALAYQALASIALRQHNPQAALDPARHALSLAPNAAEPHYLLGRALLEGGSDPAAAVHELEQAAQRAPGSPEIHFSLAKGYAKANQPQQAAQERATFAHLNELAEAQKTGTQTYAGPRETGDITSAGSQAKSSPQP